MLFSVFIKSGGGVFVLLFENYIMCIQISMTTDKISKNIPQHKRLWEIFRVSMICLRIGGLRRVHNLPSQK